jgi:hypothetical protein
MKAGGSISQKFIPFITTAIRTSNPTYGTVVRWVVL